MKSAFSHPYADFIERVQKPAQYLGGEGGQVQKDWDATAGRMCLAFPDLYEVGMSHLGYKILYGILNRSSDLLAERAYAPWGDMERELRAHRVPLLSLESARPLRDFDVVGFSLQFELTFTNVLLMLDLAGIPLRQRDRSEEDPLIVAGGPVATHAEPLAAFVDCFLIGDGEERTPELLRTWVRLREEGRSRAERLHAIASLDGIYVPSLYQTAPEPETGVEVVEAPTDPALPFPVQRTFLPNLHDHPFPHDGPVAATETIFDRVSVEIARGCTEGCRFCQAGMIYRPVRERKPEDILTTIRRAVDEGGYDEASLTSLSTADYSAVSPLVRNVMEDLEGDRVSLSVSSLRAYGLSEDVLDEMKKTRATGLTFAPEAGTQRMRDVVNKNVTEAQLMETAERVFSRGWQKMKLYFMIGLPTEEEDDVRGIVQTGTRALEVGQKIQGKRSPKVTVSVSTHVPKPHTPFQWCAMDDYGTILEKQRMLKDEARRSQDRKSPVKLRMHDSRGSWLEGVLARGDRTLGDVIETAYQNGARFDSWEEHLDLDTWRAAFETHGVSPDKFLGTIPLSARLPWDHIDVGLEDGFLVREYRKALRNRLSPPCGKAAGAFVHHTNVEDALADSRRLVCYDCGIACNLTEMQGERLTHLRTLKAATPLPAKEKVITTPRERQKRVVADQGPIRRLRLSFRRLGPVVFSSHLDMVRLLPRVFRRAGLPVFYTEGFHPKPAMTFAPSLRLGTASLAEALDLKLRARDLGDLSADTILGRLNEASFTGVEFARAAFLGDTDRALSRVVNEVEYVAAIPNDVLASVELFDPSKLQSFFDLRRSQPLAVRREIKGIGKRVDVSAFLIDIRAGDGDAELRAAGVFGDRTPVRIRIGFLPKGSARPAEVIEALFQRDDIAPRMVRTGLFHTHEDASKRIDIFDLEGLRAAKRKAVPPAEEQPAP
ncbi:MAG: TIGR03960 family B12-binding radical SAM protein [Myxococcota bacterium]